MSTEFVGTTFQNVDDIPVEDAWLLYRAGMLCVRLSARLGTGEIQHRQHQLEPWMSFKTFESWRSYVNLSVTLEY